MKYIFYFNRKRGKDMSREFCKVEVRIYKIMLNFIKKLAGVNGVIMIC